MNKHYASKLLLFGEHTVLKGSQALAVPFDTFSGHWDFRQRPTSSSDKLLNWLEYLLNQQINGHFPGHIDLTAFQEDLNRGAYFASNIPIGYGLGSSGALCAAFYDRYARKKIPPTDESRFPELKRILALLESFFHGASSGADPLICYLNHPILIAEGAIRRIELPSAPKGKSYMFFLVDTGITRQTGPFVQHFLNACQHTAYWQKVKEQLVPATDRCIQALRRADWPVLFDLMNTLSELQLDSFDHMIPPTFRDLWKRGLRSDHFRLKICGAGGGGFLLGYSRNPAATRRLLEPYKWLELKGW